MFNEEALRKEIHRVFGEHGAHAEIFNDMMKRIKELENENEILKAKLQEANNY